MVYITLVNKKNFFIGASNIRAVLEYIWGADSENDGGFFASALVFEIRYTAHICLLVNLCKSIYVSGLMERDEFYSLVSQWFGGNLKILPTIAIFVWLTLSESTVTIEENGYTPT